MFGRDRPGMGPVLGPADPQTLLGLVDGGGIEPELVVFRHEHARPGAFADSPLCGG